MDACKHNINNVLNEILERSINIIIVEDALASNAPHIRLIQDLKLSDILVAKPSDHAYLFEKVEENKEKGHLHQLKIQDEDGTNQVYHYVNNIPLNASNPDLLVNFLEYVFSKRWKTSLS
jgi:hypothetical protein